MILVIAAALLLSGFSLDAAPPVQEGGTGRTLARSTHFKVTGYNFDLELVPTAHQLKARTTVHFTSEDEGLSTVFELNNNLKITRITDAQGRVIRAERFAQEGTVRLTFDNPVARGQASQFTMEYEGSLPDGQNQPIEGLKLAYVGDPVSYLMYPGRWFPVTGYQTDRFTADYKVTVPAAYRVLAPGVGGGVPATAPGGKVIFTYRDGRASFPGSFAVVRESGDHVASGGAPVDVYFRGAEKAQSAAYGEAAGKMLTFFTSKFGPSFVTGLTLVEIDEGSVNSYAAPGLIFLSPAGIGSKLNTRLLADEVAHQWWRYVVSPANKQQTWIDAGLATYSEMLYTEESAGRGAADELGREFSITALSNDTSAINRGQNLEEYSPEYDAVLSKKAAVVMNMLRSVVGDEAFFTGLRNFPAKYSGGSVTTDQFREVMEAASKQDLGGFFIQWMESTGTPEFKVTTKTLRTQKGFKIVGVISQDMDTFKMPLDIRVETDGNPETKRIEVAGTSTEFTIETFGRPKSGSLIIDPDNHILKYSPTLRVKVAIARGQQFSDAGDYDKAIKEYQKALELKKNSSLAHFKLGEVFFNQPSLSSAANAFREALNGDRDPAWTEVWSHISLGKIFDLSGQRDRAVNEYRQAQRTRDDTQGAQAEAEKYLKEPYRRESKN